MTANSGQRPAAVTTLTIPAPGPWVSTNGQRHKHPHAQAKAVAPWRRLVALLARDLPPVVGPVAITATVHKSRNGRWDIDGIAPTVKACIDGLRDSGVLADDDDRHVVALTLRVGCVCRDARVELRIEVAPC